MQTGLQKLTDGELVAQTHELVKQERLIGLEIISRLQEISRRRLFAERGYSSLFSFCVEELGYPSSSAWNLINTMKVVQEVPEVEKKIEQGQLSVATVSQVQAFCTAEAKKDPSLNISEMKQALLSEVENKSKREAEVILASKLPEKPYIETQRILSASQIEIKFVVTPEQMKKMEKVKELISHQLWDPSFGELIEWMSDQILEKIDPEKKKSTSVPAPKEQEILKEDLKKTENHFSGEAAESHKSSSPLQSTSAHSSGSRYISQITRRKVWIKYGGQCAYICSETDKRCQERRNLEYDHIIPFALGGNHSEENIQLICKAHNQLRAIHSYGLEKMKPYLNIK